MRVGVQGRVIAGPAGAPSQVDVPLRYAVVKEGVDPKTITTKFRRFPVAVAPGTANVVFTDIEEDLSFPIPPRGVCPAISVHRRALAGPSIVCPAAWRPASLTKSRTSLGVATVALL